MLLENVAGSARILVFRQAGDMASNMTPYTGKNLNNELPQQFYTHSGTMNGLMDREHASLTERWLMADGADGTAGGTRGVPSGQQQKLMNSFRIVPLIQLATGNKMGKCKNLPPFVYVWATLS